MGNKIQQMQAYLLQRGKIMKYGSEYNTYALLDFVDLEYMGYSEYESGQIPRCLNFMAKQKENYSLIKTKFKNPKGKSLYIYGPTEYLKNIEETFKNFIKVQNDRFTKGRNKIYNAFQILMGNLLTLIFGGKYNKLT